MKSHSQDLIELLRKHERYCFQVAYFLLQDEAEAVKVCIQALKTMYSTLYVNKLEGEELKKKFKTTVITESLKLRKQILSERQ